MNWKIYVNLKETENKKGFSWEKWWQYYYVFPASEEMFNSKWIVYRALMYTNKENFDKKVAGERIDADLISSVKEHQNDKGTWYWGMMFNNDTRQAFFVNIYDNEMKTPEKNYDKLLVINETEWREKGTSTPATEAPF